MGLFEGDNDAARFAALAAIVPNLLICVAVYSLADAVNVTFSFALRGAGDTRFVSLLTFTLAWPIMVIPTFLVVQGGWSLDDRFAHARNSAVGADASVGAAIVAADPA